MQMSLQSAIALNLPHALEAQCGNWRDWILGMTVMLADGSIVKCGSKVVKNVAGYDVHKMLVGARGTLGLILDVTLKTVPTDSLPKHSIEIRRRSPKMAGPEHRMPSLWIQRTKPSDFERAVEAAGEKTLEIDWASSTLWADVPYEEDLPRYPNDWVVRRGCDEKNFQITDPATVILMKRAKAILDPQNKFNPGAMGVV
jgi:glycolate oxidase FAD binding subunit